MKFYVLSACGDHPGMRGTNINRALLRFRPQLSDLQIRRVLMRLNISAFFLLAGLLQVSAATYAQRITLNKKNAPLAEIFKSIQAQSSYDFVFSNQLVNLAHKVTIEVKEASLEETLKLVFKDQPFTYQIEDKTIVVKRLEEPSLLDRAKALFAQVTVNGKVTDDTGQPLAGVTVRVRDSNVATATDKNGSYSLTIPDDKAILAFSFIGYETIELAAKEIPSGSVIKLKATQTNLKEVVVSKGYYNTTQELNTGSVTKITSEVFDKQPVSDPIMALEGRVPGLYINQASGLPGANEKVILRGQNSIANGNDPLYVIDGIPITSIALSNPGFSNGPFSAQPTPTNPNSVGGISPFSDLNPLDIESIEVLKDGDATAIYGSRGANGVILITTKKGKAGSTRIDANINSGFGQVTRKMDLLNTQQYLQLRGEAFANDGLPVPSITVDPSDNQYDINGTWNKNSYTDWQKALIGGTAHYTNAQLSLSGGNTNTQFLISGNFNRQTTVFPGTSNDKKSSMHFSLNHTSTNQKFHANFSGQFTNDVNNMPFVDLTQYIMLPPDAPSLYDANGNINFQNGTFNNPLSYLLAHFGSSNKNLIGSLILDYKLLPGLTLRSTQSYTRTQMDQNQYFPAIATYGPPSADNRISLIANTFEERWIIEPQINYIKAIGKGKLNALIGTTFEEHQNNTAGFRGTGFSSDALITNISSASTIAALPSNFTDYRYNALYARIGYNWEEKYVLNLIGRRDGSSRFGPGKQFGNFGSVGGGWIFTKEKWMDKASDWLSYGKLRGSFAVTGNDQISDYQYLSSYSTSGNYQNTTGLVPSRITNPYFGWEVNKKIDAAIELGFFKDRILLTTDYYRNRSANQLVAAPLPSIDGFTSIQENLPAVVQNKGWEFSLNTVNLKNKSLTWTTSFNMTIPQNELISFPGLATSTYNSKVAIGMPLSTQYLFHYTGVDPQTGIYMFHLDDSGNPDNSFTKAVSQKFYGGLNNSFTYKNWQIDIFVQFVKQTGLNYLAYIYPAAISTNQNLPVDFLNRWQSPGQLTNIQKVTAVTVATDAFYSSLNLNSSDAIISDASFIRLKNVSISYTLPRLWQEQARLKSARIYLQMQNLFTITNYKGLDPETQGLVLPPMRMITAGIQVSL